MIFYINGINLADYLNIFIFGIKEHLFVYIFLWNNLNKHILNCWQQIQSFQLQKHCWIGNSLCFIWVAKKVSVLNYMRPSKKWYVTEMYYLFFTQLELGCIAMFFYIIGLQKTLLQYEILNNFFILISIIHLSHLLRFRFT